MHLMLQLYSDKRKAQPRVFIKIFIEYTVYFFAFSVYLLQSATFDKIKTKGVENFILQGSSIHVIEYVIFCIYECISKVSSRIFSLSISFFQICRFFIDYIFNFKSQKNLPFRESKKITVNSSNNWSYFNAFVFLECSLYYHWKCRYSQIYISHFCRTFSSCMVGRKSKTNSMGVFYFVLLWGLFDKKL